MFDTPCFDGFEPGKADLVAPRRLYSPEPHRQPRSFAFTLAAISGAMFLRFSVSARMPNLHNVTGGCIEGQEIQALVCVAGRIESRVVGSMEESGSVPTGDAALGSRRGHGAASRQRAATA